MKIRTIFTLLFAAHSNYTSWLQFADDAALIANSCESAQSLINIAVGWREWANMKLRIECVSFGLRKRNGIYEQFMPSLFINETAIPAVKIGESFKYLGKIFDFAMDSKIVKSTLLEKLSTLLSSISKLNISASTKLKILKVYIPSQLTFDLRINDLSATWIDQSLDALINKSIRLWLNLPISSCVAEIRALPKTMGGLGITSH